MTHYIDIHLRRDPEFSAQHLLAALYAKLHRALVQLKSDNIGVSFPALNSGPRLGEQLRLFGPVAALDKLVSQDWLTGMRDHVTVGNLVPVPTLVQHRPLRRVQAKSSPERLRRRQMKRHGLTEAQARAQIPDSVVERLDLPFVQLTSASTGQPFRLYLRLGPPQSAMTTGHFNAYGLSATATTPCF